MLGLPGEELIPDLASKTKTGKRSNKDVPGTDRVGKKREGRVTNICPRLPPPNLSHTNEPSLLKQIMKRKSEINRQSRKRGKNCHTETHQEVKAPNDAKPLAAVTGDEKVVRKRKAIREGDLRNVSMSEAQAKSAIAEDKKKADNRSMPWLAGTHDHTHRGSAKNTTRRVCNKVRKNWADRNGRDLDWVLRDSGPDDVVSRHR